MTPFALRRYRLERAPRTPVLVRASSYGIPAATADDYARLAAYQPDSTAPVLLDHAQYVRFMSELVDALWQALGAETRVFVRFRMPYNGALPANLLDPRVLIGSGLDTQMAFWSRVEAQPGIGIVDRIRRDLDYPGDNTLAFACASERRLDALEAALLRDWPRYAIRLARAADAAGQPARPPARFA
ncbi:Uncharacterised protein [Burkholderia pseudomallei]|uniref:hypothetical protein n=1 Tax=Burkholderia pseudomallei TaxID=28450 RepID=UPI00014F9820|nr:hypothetical protein [Burkholderia pseudomallei]EIF62542.1 hypothetical protein BP1258A_2427 [Burkholderia pseudomallei 1258a]AGR70331.1 hypothetical protein BDL_1491 [Burkholderia pseudomallei MSHR305]AHK64210.1 hypothetical protein BBX_3439 [Burkholderia pseudomallei MSHR520]AIP78471.1 hypothetical protein JE55_2139 [Burkholderia pseudomallei]APZ18024.1 hypothetical protein BGI47_04840 [Burkholderia pseudomallei]